MLKLTENFCILETKNTSLWLKTGEGAPKLLYFGEKIAGPEGAEFAPVPAAPLFLQPCDPSPVGETVRACLADGSPAAEFAFAKARIGLRPASEGSPQAEGEAKCLRLEFSDAASRLRLTLRLTAFGEADAYGVSASLTNGGKRPVRLMQLDPLCLIFPAEKAALYRFCSMQAREEETPLADLPYVTDPDGSDVPYFAVEGREGAVACTLVWSGKCRIRAAARGESAVLVMGACPEGEIELAAGETFTTPEAVFSCGKTRGEAFARLRALASVNCLRGRVCLRERPVVFEDASDTAEEAMRNAARAARLGGEVFLLSAACTEENGPLYAERAELSERIRALGLKVGMRLTLERLRTESELYRRHPEYFLRFPRREAGEYAYPNFADPQVQGVVYRAAAREMESCKAAFVVWDCVRIPFGAYAKDVPAGEFAYRFLAGLYAVRKRLAERFPNVLFEAGLSRGVSYDLGKLCVFPQVSFADMAMPSSVCSLFPASCMGGPRFFFDMQDEEIAARMAEYAFFRSSLLGAECCSQAAGTLLVSADRSRALLFPLKRDRGDHVRLFGLDEGSMYELTQAGEAGMLAVSGGVLCRCGISVRALFSAFPAADRRCILLTRRDLKRRPRV